MTCCTHKSLVAVVCAVGLAALTGSIAMTQSTKDSKPPKATAPGAPAGPQDIPLPPGWTAADMKACMDSGVPGPMHQVLAKNVGTWTGQNQMWMPGATEPMKSSCTNTVSATMGGRYTKSEMAGEMPGMGPFNGMAITGFDNTTQKFVCSWIDNQGTGIMNGVGELSKDGKTMNWVFTYNCPIQKKVVTMKQVETYPDPNTMVLEMWMTDPKTHKEYKCMRIDFAKNS